MTAMFSGSVKRLGLSESERLRRRRLAIVILVAIVVGMILFVDGYLTCWYLAKRKAASLPGAATSCATQELVYVERYADPIESSASGKPGSYSHDVLGLAFDFPSQWGQVALREEYGQTASGNNIIVGLRLSFDVNGEPVVFLHASNPNTEQVARPEDGWGGDSVNVSSLHDVQTWCDGRDNCELFTNAHGFLIAKTMTLDGEGEQAKPYPVYYLFNPESGYGGVALSPKGLEEAGIADETLEQDFAALVDSISLTLK